MLLLLLIAGPTDNDNYFECLHPANIRNASSIPMISVKNGTTVRMLEKGRTTSHSRPKVVTKAIVGEITPKMAYKLGRNIVILDKRGLPQCADSCTEGSRQGWQA